MKELAKRKKLLIAESEVYREVLKLELHNLKIAGIVAKKKMTSFSLINPAFLMSLPMATSLFARTRRFKWKRLGALAFVGWRTYQRFMDLRRRRAHARQTVVRKTAAEQFLEKRI